MSDSFIHITDLHFWEIIRNPLRMLNKRAIGNANVILKRQHDFLMERAWEYVEYINALEPKDVIITGDFASTATQFEFEQGVKFIKLLEEAGKEVTVIPGNHDVYTFETVRKKEFGKYFFQWLPDEPPPCIHPLSGGTPIVYVPTVCPNFLSSKGNITNFEIETTVALIEALKSPVIVAGHYPILTETEVYSAKGNRELRNAEKLSAALGETGKQITYLCGHVHRFSDITDPYYKNIRHITTGALFRTAPETNSTGDLTVFNINDAGIQVNRHVHRNGGWSTG